MRTPERPAIDIKIVNGRFVTVYPYLPPDEIELTWPIRKTRGASRTMASNMFYDGPNLMQDYVNSREDNG